MTHLYLVRHGETIWNAEKRMQGHMNSDLTDQGKEQARLLGEKFATTTFDACYTSDSPRALETAQLVTQYLPTTPVTDSRLREIGMGSWEGRTRQEIANVDGQEWHHFWETPHLYQAKNGGETFHHLRQRSMASIDEILLKHTDQKILIVSHRLTIKTIINQLLAQDLDALNSLADLEPNSLSSLTVTPQETTILSYSDTSHYQ